MCRVCRQNKRRKVRCFRRIFSYLQMDISVTVKSSFSICLSVLCAIPRRSKATNIIFYVRGEDFDLGKICIGEVLSVFSSGCLGNGGALANPVPAVVNKKQTGVRSERSLQKHRCRTAAYSCDDGKCFRCAWLKPQKRARL